MHICLNTSVYSIYLYWLIECSQYILFVYINNASMQIIYSNSNHIIYRIYTTMFLTFVLFILKYPISYPESATSCSTPYSPSYRTYRQTTLHHRMKKIAKYNKN